MVQLVDLVYNVSCLYWLFRDCQELFQVGERQSGLFEIQFQGFLLFLVNCKMILDGGWIVIQRCYDGLVDFNWFWEVYKVGFGDFYGEFWLGLEKVYSIMGDCNSCLVVQLWDWDGNVELLQFFVYLGGEDMVYSLQFIVFVVGQLGVIIVLFSGFFVFFFIWDQDYDFCRDKNCVKSFFGGWWFGICSYFNFNGQYFCFILQQWQKFKKGIFWKIWWGCYYLLQVIIMLIQFMVVEVVFQCFGWVWFQVYERW